MMKNFQFDKAERFLLLQFFEIQKMFLLYQGPTRLAFFPFFAFFFGVDVFPLACFTLGAEGTTLQVALLFFPFAPAVRPMICMKLA